MQPPHDQERYWTYILRRTRECNDAEKAGKMDRREARGSIRSDDLDERPGRQRSSDEVSIEETPKD